MRWHEEALDIHGLPAADSVQLVGIIEDGEAKVNVEYYHDGKLFVNTAWSKAIQVRRGEDLINEEVAEKFWPKVVKVKTQHEGKKFSEWLPFFAATLSESDKKELTGV
jgi:hypothetical protein